MISTGRLAVVVPLQSLKFISTLAVVPSNDTTCTVHTYRRLVVLGSTTNRTIPRVFVRNRNKKVERKFHIQPYCKIDYYPQGTDI